MTKVLTFDVYGTLVQWDETLAQIMRDLLHRHGRGDRCASLAANAFEAESRRLQTTGAFRSYRGILCDSLKPAFATAALTPSKADEDYLLSGLSRIPAFIEVPTVLDALSRDYRLAPISNTDDDLIAGTLSQFGDLFGTIVTAQKARAYKPNPGLFRFALDELGVGRDDIIHVAQGPFSDLAVCTALGIRMIWVNRQNMALQEGLEPTATIRDLNELPAVLAGLS